jgi:activating signal cointegrator complex subunit 3
VTRIHHLHRTYVQAMRVLIIDEIHLLGDERGPVLEVIVSRTNFISSHTQHKVQYQAYGSKLC